MMAYISYIFILKLTVSFIRSVFCVRVLDKPA